MSINYADPIVWIVMFLVGSLAFFLLRLANNPANVALVVFLLTFLGAATRMAFPVFEAEPGNFRLSLVVVTYETTLRINNIQGSEAYMLFGGCLFGVTASLIISLAFKRFELRALELSNEETKLRLQAAPLATLPLPSTPISVVTTHPEAPKH